MSKSTRFTLSFTTLATSQSNLLKELCNVNVILSRKWITLFNGSPTWEGDGAQRLRLSPCRKGVQIASDGPSLRWNVATILHLPRVWSPSLQKEESNDLTELTFSSFSVNYDVHVHAPLASPSMWKLTTPLADHSANVLSTTIKMPSSPYCWKFTPSTGSSPPRRCSS